MVQARQADRADRQLPGGAPGIFHLRPDEGGHGRRPGDGVRPGRLLGDPARARCVDRRRSAVRGDRLAGLRRLRQALTWAGSTSLRWPLGGGPDLAALVGSRGASRPGRAGKNGGMMAFVQVIEMTTTKVAEIEELMSEWVAATEGRRSARRSLLAHDRERPRYLRAGGG